MYSSDVISSIDLSRSVTAEMRFTCSSMVSSFLVVLSSRSRLSNRSAWAFVEIIPSGEGKHVPVDGGDSKRLVEDYDTHRDITADVLQVVPRVQLDLLGHHLIRRIVKHHQELIVVCERADGDVVGTLTPVPSQGLIFARPRQPSRRQSKIIPELLFLLDKPGQRTAAASRLRLAQTEYVEDPAAVVDNLEVAISNQERPRERSE